ncbi:FUSC family protein [Methylobacterium sp. JK268]
MADASMRGAADAPPDQPVPPGSGGAGFVDSVLDRLDPRPLSDWLYALRIWLAMMLALYAGFWLELESASSAAVTVAILAQPRRGQALAKALSRFLGTLIGFAVALLLTALFGQDRTLMLIAFAAWLGICVFTGSYLQGVRAYGAMLSGYTVAIIAIANIDSPQSVFANGVARTAAVTLGIIAVTFVNDALGAPAVFPQLRQGVGEAIEAARAFALRAVREGDPGAEEAVAVLRRASAPRDSIEAVAPEFHDGEARAAGARSAIAAVLAAVAAARAFAVAARRVGGTEARDLARRVEAGLTGDEAALPGLVARLDYLIVDAAATPDRVWLMRRAVDLLRQDRLARDGAASLATGRRPRRDVVLPVHRERRLALRNAARAVVAFLASAAIFVLAGWPSTATALVQVAAFTALSGINPNPPAFAAGAMLGLPLAAAAAGIVEFLVLDGAQGFPLLALAMAPVVFLACFLSLRPRTGSLGFILLVFFPVILSPANPQPYNPQTYVVSSLLFCLSGIILFLTLRLIPPVREAEHRRWSLLSARRDVADSLRGATEDPEARLARDCDRLVQFAGWRGSNGAAHRAGLRHAFALAGLDVDAAGAHAALDALAADPACRGPVAAARRALAATDPGALREAAAGLLAAGGARRTLARAVADLAEAAYLLEVQRPVFRRLALGTTG